MNYYSEGRSVMRELFAAVAFATVVAVPAFAQSFDPSVASGNLNATPYRGGQTLQGGTPHDVRAQTRQLRAGTVCGLAGGTVTGPRRHSSAGAAGPFTASAFQARIGPAAA